MKLKLRTKDHPLNKEIKRFRMHMMWLFMAVIMFFIAFVTGAESYRNVGTYTDGNGITVIVEQYEVMLNDVELEYVENTKESFLTEHWYLPLTIFVFFLILIVSFFQLDDSNNTQTTSEGD